jgi:hypothetical protein
MLHKEYIGIFGVCRQGGIEIQTRQFEGEWPGFPSHGIITRLSMLWPNRIDIGKTFFGSIGQFGGEWPGFPESR